MPLLQRIVAWLRRLWKHLRRKPLRHPRYGRRQAPPASPVRTRAKPAWIHQEIIALAARAPALSCRDLRNVFNRRHEGRHSVGHDSVGHDFVWRVLRNHQAAIRLERKRLKRRSFVLLVRTANEAP